jgi:hypothetical protein
MKWMTLCVVAAFSTLFSFWTDSSLAQENCTFLVQVHFSEKAWEQEVEEVKYHLQILNRNDGTIHYAIDSESLKKDRYFLNKKIITLDCFKNGLNSENTLVFISYDAKLKDGSMNHSPPFELISEINHISQTAKDYQLAAQSGKAQFLSQEFQRGRFQRIRHPLHRDGNLLA